MSVQVRAVPVSEEKADRAGLLHLYYRGVSCGSAVLSRDGAHAKLKLLFSAEADSEAMRHVTAFLTSKAETELRPDFIEAEYTWEKNPGGQDSEVRTALAANRYELWDGCFVRITEDWRKKIPDDAFDEEGYLINQKRLQKIPFGRFDSGGRGCGWIAAYNFMKLNGREPYLKETAEELDRNVWFGGLAGISLNHLQRFLKGRGFPVRMLLGSEKKVCEEMRRASTGILLYILPAGLHFTAFVRTDRNRYRFFNSVYGERDDVLSDTEFFRQRVLLPVAGLLWLRDGNDGFDNTNME